LPPKVSIITVYYNTPEDLRTLDRTMKQFLPRDDYEWIVADNQSEIDLSNELSGVRYLRMPGNLGFAAASNRAAESARAPNLFFLNPDCEFIENCLPPLLEALKVSAIAGPRVMNADGSIQLSFGPALSFTKEAFQKALFRFEKSNAVQQWIAKKGTFHPDYVSGCALMIRASVFQELQGFDENFFLYNEDVDLCKRVRSQSLNVQYVPQSRIVHRRNQSVQQTPDRVRTEYRRSQIYYYKKHHGALQNLLLKLYLGISGKSPAPYHS
jgi:GT2 family glycosyltransferase